MSEHKPSDELTKFVDDYLGGCPNCRQQAEQILEAEEDNVELCNRLGDAETEIKRLKELLKEASTFFAGGRLSDEIKQALAAQPQKGE